MQFSKSTGRLSAAAVIALGGLAASASANFTEIENEGEVTHEFVLQTLYGSGIEGVTGTEIPGGAPGVFEQYTNAGNVTGGNPVINIYRVADSGGSSPINVKTDASQLGNYNDQVWTDGTVRTRAQARFAGDRQNFGYIPGASGNFGAYEQLFAVTGSGFNVSNNTAELQFSPGEQWRWARAGNNLDSNGDVIFDPNAGPGLQGHTSNPFDNADRRDHMVTYYVDIDGQLPIWVLFFEDRNVGQQHEDFDFNDLVVELRVIPLPGPAMMGLAGLGGLALVRRRRN